MEIPKFRKRLTFMDDISAPCLKATLPNSSVPNLAAREIKKRMEDPDFEILLRAKDPSRITPWQNEMLERLLKKGGLAEAIEQGMKDYKTERGDEYLDYEKRNWEDIERNGVLPHIVLSAVVIDDIRREVILQLNTSVDIHLEEHGAAIYLKDGQWKFDTDYVYDYMGEVEDEESGRETPSDFKEEEDEPVSQKSEGDTLGLRNVVTGGVGGDFGVAELQHPKISLNDFLFSCLFQFPCATEQRIAFNLPSRTM